MSLLLCSLSSLMMVLSLCVGVALHVTTEFVAARELGKCAKLRVFYCENCQLWLLSQNESICCCACSAVLHPVGI